MSPFHNSTTVIPGVWFNYNYSVEFILNFELTVTGCILLTTYFENYNIKMLKAN